MFINANVYVSCENGKTTVLVSSGGQLISVEDWVSQELVADNLMDKAVKFVGNAGIQLLPDQEN